MSYLKPAIVITGAASGLGLALARKMVECSWDVYGLDLTQPNEVTARENVSWYQCDVTQEQEVQFLASRIHRMRDQDPLKVLVNCAGVNAISPLESLATRDWEHIIGVNAKGIFLTAKSFLPYLKQSKGTICNITSDAAWKPMSHSLAYNASKGAAHIMTLQLARELTRAHDICVFGVAPGKLAGTGMSQYIDRKVCEVRHWTPEEASAYAQAGRLHPEEVPPHILAEFLAYLLCDPLRHRYLSGCIIPYGA